MHDFDQRHEKSIKDHKSLSSGEPITPSTQQEQVKPLEQAEELEDVAAEGGCDIELPAGEPLCI